MAQFDRAGRYRKIYLPRLDPREQWRYNQYVAKYRLSPERVNWLAQKYSASGVSRTKGTSTGGGQTHEQQVTLALRFMATGANFDAIAASQQVSTATVSRCVEDVTKYLYVNSNEFICWPNTMNDKIEVATEFHKLFKKKPNVIGCIDGTHMQIVSPSRDREAVFINRKGFYSLNTMVVCDANNFITHLDASFAGSATDSLIYNYSPLKEDAESGSWGDFFLLADSGYGLSDHLYTPYLNPSNGTERRFNSWHKSSRSLIERTIGIWKQRWRCLDQSGGYLHLTPEKAGQVITACGCVHNLAVLDRTPHLEHLDDGNDRFVYRHPAPRQPRDFPNRDVVHTARDVYARTWFGPTLDEEED